MTTANIAQIKAGISTAWADHFSVEQAFNPTFEAVRELQRQIRSLAYGAVVAQDAELEEMATGMLAALSVAEERLQEAFAPLAFPDKKLRSHLTAAFERLSELEKGTADTAEPTAAVGAEDEASQAT